MEYLFSDKTISFNQDVLETFRSFRQVGTHQHEAGGILLGRIYQDGKVIVEQISTPGRYDKSGKYFFERNVKYAQQIVNKAWKDSNGEIQYLGEWHTHPEMNPTPSSVDHKLLKGMINDSKLEIDFLFLVIVGIDGFYVASQTKDEELRELHLVR
ncbi:hypothetical protein BSK65_29385 [Paenibacillus odorifer]|uniref:JAB domain-containing protein n=1 Tax=Paenibacillus odorifer TaxID=189426 RepID=A0A1R0Z835_9BACL|nr:Mov34/MPN/PAD-1 family protein [Paenibacillus odorifer]OME64248.1 hypothetical protein BSK65_29385 [Paenibacillus odorifer]